MTDSKQLASQLLSQYGIGGLLALVLIWGFYRFTLVPMAEHQDKEYVATTQRSNMLMDIIQKRAESDEATLSVIAGSIERLAVTIGNFETFVVGELKSDARIEDCLEILVGGQAEIKDLIRAQGN